MRPMTAANLRSAFGGESQAHMRYLIYSDKAREEGFSNIARLFVAISDAERIHATRHFEAMSQVKGDFVVTSGAGFGLASTTENLEIAISGENFEINEMYPAYLAVAKDQGEGDAVESMRRALLAEKAHTKMYQKAKESADAGKDMELGVVQICQECGWTLEGNAPDKCPVCQKPKEYFKSFA